MFTVQRLRIVAFSLLLALFASAISLSFLIRDTQRYDAALINIVGRQRMLAQQIAFEAAMARAFPGEGAGPSLHSTSRKGFETALNALMDGGEVTLPTGEIFEIRPSPDSEIREQLATVYETWGEVEDQIHILLDKNQPGEAQDASVQKIIELKPGLIHELEELARLYEAASNRNIVRLQGIQLAFLVAAALLLGAVIHVTNLRILRPIQALGESAARIGRGDFKTPVAIRGLKEVALLAKNMEEMRGKLNADLQTETALVALSQYHLKAADEDKAMARAVETAAKIVSADYASAALLDHEGRLVVRAIFGASAKRFKGWELEQGRRSQARFAIQQGKPALAGSYGKRAKFLAPSLALKLNISSGLSVPMLLRGRPIGAMLVYSKTPHRFKAEDIPVLSLIANQTAIAVDRIRLFNERTHLAFTDELTGLYNRRHLLKLADWEVNRAARYKHPLAAIMFDLDRFKQINDKYGHPAGDQVLKAVATLARRELRDIDLIGRYGGDEFIVLVPETGEKGAKALAERLRKRIARAKIAVGEAEVSITISLGVATLSRTRNTLSRLIEASDKALYAAKSAGRNRSLSGGAP